MRDLEYPFTMLRIAPSMKCNFNNGKICPQCTHFRYHRDLMEKTSWAEVSPDVWLKHLARIKPLRSLRVVLGVGEPTMYDGIEEIVNGLSCKTLFYTNASDFAMKKIRRFMPRSTLGLYVSYHPLGISAENFVENVKWLQNTFHIIDFHAVPYPGRENRLDEDKEMMAKHGISLRIDHPFAAWDNNRLYFYDHVGGDQPRFKDRFAGRLSGKVRDVLCKTSVNHFENNMSMSYPIAPNGDIYVCWRYFLAGSKDGILGNFFDEDFKYNDNYFECSNYGDCNICSWDRNIIDKKTNRQLDCDTIVRAYV